MYCWGSTPSGELGLGGIEEQQIRTPRHLSLPPGATIVQVGCGYDHTLFLAADGTVYTCGNNDCGQLGHAEQHTRPVRVSALENYPIHLVAAGDQFSLAVTAWGGLFSWGNNRLGQLGTGNAAEFSQRPRQLRAFSVKRAVQVCCGQSHSLALTEDGDVLAWGSNEYGQLGLGGSGEPLGQPTVVAALSSLPLARIACGAHHCLALTKCGLVLSWGRNSFSQLGLSVEQDVYRPAPVRALDSQRVRHITAGESHSAALTQDGAVFTFGAGMYGQLGHAGRTTEVNPRQVLELMGSRVTQLVCGRHHTLVYVSSASGTGGKVMAFGLGGAGQLGCADTQLALAPQTVTGPWSASSDSPDMLRLAGGGQQSFLFKVEDPDLADDRVWRRESQILQLTPEAAERLQKLPSTPAADEEEDQSRLRQIEFLETVLGSAACINGSFLSPGDRQPCTSEDPRLDLAACQTALRALLRASSDTVTDLVASRLSTLPASLPGRPPDIEALRLYFILLLNGPALSASEPAFSTALLRLPEKHSAVLGGWLKRAPPASLQDAIRLYKLAVLRHIRRADTLSQCRATGSWKLGGRLEMALKTLRFLHSVLLGEPTVSAGRSEKPVKTSPMHAAAVQTESPVAGGSSSARDVIGAAADVSGAVTDETFYIPELTELVSVPLDYVGWQLSPDRENAHFLCHYPFVFDATAKTQLLQTDALLQMRSAMETAAEQQLFSALLTGQPQGSQFLTLVVSRDKLVEETLQQLSQSTRTDLKKPLRVKFVGEEGEDAGGVRKEFFLVLTRALLDPSYGMFKEYEDTHRIWFSQDSYEDIVMYFLIGIVCGLAIYNSTIVNLPFPLALYKKLQGQPVSLLDLKQLDPVTARSLQALLDYTGDDVEDVFSLTFEVSREVYGRTETSELMPGGGETPVTENNRQEYVRLYVDYVLSSSIAAQYAAFQDGFLKVCGGKVLQLFTAPELMTLVTGHENYDWKVFEENAEYREGYTRDSGPVQLFWQVFHELTEDQKKKFLLFLTGTDRVPITGMKAIKMFIQPSRGGESFLPVAHTCFNLLDLPEYSTTQRLKYKLLQAMAGTEGFALA